VIRHLGRRSLSLGSSVRKGVKRGNLNRRTGPYLCLTLRCVISQSIASRFVPVIESTIAIRSRCWPATCSTAGESNCALHPRPLCPQHPWPLRRSRLASLRSPRPQKRAHRTRSATRSKHGSSTRSERPCTDGGAEAKRGSGRVIDCDDRLDLNGL